jgi:hypothetical protein
MQRFIVNFKIALGFFLIIFIQAEGFSMTSGDKSDSVQDTSHQKSKIPKQPVYSASRLTTAKPVVDGKLDDECWKTGYWAGNFTQFIPNEGAKPSSPTEFKILYDNKNLYVALRAFDSEPKKIQRFSGARDEFAGDIMGINFDSYHDRRTGFEFSVTAWGQKIDLVLFNPMNWDFNWNPVWKVRTGMEDSAWIAEYEIPLNQLRYSTENEQVWGLHLWRWINRFQEESDWEIQSKTGPGMLYNFGELHGIKGLKKSQRLEIMPYVLGKLNTLEKEPGNPFTSTGKAWRGNFGLDAKIGLSSNFTVDLTVNPDFGQVESDPSVMNLTAFETFYEEKRPFFLEGLTIFDYKFDNQSLFYSRRIGHTPSLTINSSNQIYVNAPEATSILSAVKLSGTTSSGLSVGLIQSVTANEFAQLSDIDGVRSLSKVEPVTSYTIARIQKGYNAGNTVIGGIVTSTNRFIDDRSLEFLSNNAYTGGLDLLHHWKEKEFYIDARLIGSTIIGTPESIKLLQESSARYYQRPDAGYLKYDTTSTRLSGFGGKFMIGKGSKGLWRYSTGATWLSPGLELNDLGYMNTSDQISQRNLISYLIIKPVSVFRQYSLGLEQYNNWNFNGNYLGSGANFSFTSELINLWNLAATMNLYSNSLDTKILRGGDGMIMPYTISSIGSLVTDQSKKIVAGIKYNYQYRGNNSANSYSILPSIIVRPASILKIGVSANYMSNHDDLQYVTTISYLSEKRYILSKIDQQTLGFTFRADLNLTPEFSLQYYGSPFISKGKYIEFKHVTNPKANSYEDRFSIYRNLQLVGNQYLLDENNDGVTDYSIDNPDFNFHQFRSNLIAKWEYRLGSYIYLVWSSERTASADPSQAFMADAYNQFRYIYPKNIFLIKINYWFSL